MAEVYSKDAAIATHERAKVAERLGLFQDAEAVGLSGNGKVDPVPGFNLEKDAGVWSTFVKLSG